MQIIQHCFRVYAESADLEATIQFYENLQRCTCERRVSIPETNIEAAKVGAFLILAGDEKHLAAVRHVSAIFYIDALDDFCAWLEGSGAHIIHAPRVVTGGRSLTARHPDGLVAEYFEARS